MPTLPQVTPQQFTLMFIFQCLAAVSVATDARQRGKEFGLVYLWSVGAFLIPLLFLPLWLLVRPKSGVVSASAAGAPAIEARTRVCDHCSKFFKTTGNQCPHCGQPVNGAAPIPRS